MKLNDMMTKPTFPPLEVGNHNVTILGYEVRTVAETGEDYLYISFAPSNEPRHIHGVALFVNDKVNFVNGLIANLQRILRLPGATLVELLEASKGVTIPANLTANVQPDDGKLYYNWTLGWSRPADVTPVGPAPGTVTSTPTRKARA